MRRAAVLILLLAGLTSATACAPDGVSDAPGRVPRAAPPERETASLLLVTLDTFRADAAGSGGNPLGRTPHLDRLARTGIQWETGISASPLTLPSHATMLTGLHPPAHGIRDNGTYRLPDGVPTIAECLATAGFETAAFLTAFPLHARFGLDRGFDVYDDEFGGPSGQGDLTMAQRPGVEAVGAAGDWWEKLPERDGALRWFAWIHLFDAHSPHGAPRPLVVAAGGDHYLADTGVADRALGAAVRAASEAPGDPWILVVGDHGEGRGDHGETTHGIFVYDATIRIPVVLAPAPPGERTGLRRAAFPMVDLAATAFELLDLDPSDAPGRGAAVLSEPASPAYFETLYPWIHHGWSDLRGIRIGDWKYVRAPELELYDMETDPGELRNIATNHAETVARLEALLAAEETAPLAAAAIPLDDEAREALESLGYVTSTAVDSDHAPESPVDDPRPLAMRPDPKRMTRVQGILENAQTLMATGRWARGIRSLSLALSFDPHNKDIHHWLGVAHAAVGDDRKAVDSFLACLNLPPHQGDRTPRFKLASAYIRLGRPEKAVLHLRKVIEAMGEDADTLHNLGIAWQDLGELEKARQAWDRALALDPRHALARAARASLDSRTSPPIVDGSSPGR